MWKGNEQRKTAAFPKQTTGRTTGGKTAAFFSLQDVFQAFFFPFFITKLNQSSLCISYYMLQFQNKSSNFETKFAIVKASEFHEAKVRLA